MSMLHRACCNPHNAARESPDDNDPTNKSTSFSSILTGSFTALDGRLSVLGIPISKVSCRNTELRPIRDSACAT